MARKSRTAPTVEQLQARLDRMVAAKPELSWDSFMMNADELHDHRIDMRAWLNEVIGEAWDAAEWN